MQRRRVHLAAALALFVCAAFASTALARGGLHVSGARLLDGRGRHLILRGVNRSGTEYACIQG